MTGSIPMWCSWQPTFRLAIQKRLKFFLTSIHGPEQAVIRRNLEQEDLRANVTFDQINPFRNNFDIKHVDIPVFYPPSHPHRSFWMKELEAVRSAESKNRYRLVMSGERYLMAVHGQVNSGSAIPSDILKTSYRVNAPYSQKVIERLK